MQDAREFFREFVRSRTDVLRQIYRVREPHMRQFFASHYCPWDEEKGVNNSESESVESVETTDQFTRLITKDNRFGGYPRHTRYTLVAADGGWRIESMERQCGLCHGSGLVGEVKCDFCNGKGWTLIGELRPRS